MRSVAALRRRVGFSVLMLACIVLSGCKTWDGGPDRLYSVDEERATARGLLDGATSNDLPGLIERYYAKGVDEGERIFLRNEIITRRMYIIDVEYSEYEAALTSERQKFGFLTTAAASTLGIAATLTSPLRSAQIVSGTGAAVLGARGAYDSEVVIAKTVQVIQGYMRAARDNVATRQILPRLTETTVTYPLSTALHDLEDYFRAGTFTAGLIPALKDSGTAAKNASDEKTFAVTGIFSPDKMTALLDQYLEPNGKLDHKRLGLVNRCLNQFPMLRGPELKKINILSHMDAGGSSIAVRVQAVKCAQQDPAFLTMLK